MKKILLVFLFVFVLSGCSGSDGCKRIDNVEVVERPSWSDSDVSSFAVELQNSTFFEKDVFMSIYYDDGTVVLVQMPLAVFKLLDQGWFYLIKKDTFFFDTLYLCTPPEASPTAESLYY